jgi:hypothetical protein
MEGVVAKLKSGPYVSERERSNWRKILNPNYSQRIGREELFERERHKEPVPGWHSCAVAIRTAIADTSISEGSPQRCGPISIFASYHRERRSPLGIVR